MTSCPNCKAGLSCGCQKRVASNGAQVCDKCLTGYEQTLKVKASTIPGTAPSNVKVNYKAPGRLGNL